MHYSNGSKVWSLYSLQSEKQRWSQAIVQYEKQQKTLCGDVVLTSAFVSYMGYFTQQYRMELFNNKWIPFLKSQKVVSFANCVVVVYSVIVQRKSFFPRTSTVESVN